MGQFPLNILTFPLWWYTVGATQSFAWFRRQLRFGYTKSGISLFARHMREPLYGDYTRAGIIFSFFLRIILLIWKSFILSLRALYLTIILICYFLLLPAIIVMVVYQFFPIN